MNYIQQSITSMQRFLSLKHRYMNDLAQQEAEVRMSTVAVRIWPEAVSNLQTPLPKRHPYPYHQSLMHVWYPTMANSGYHSCVQRSQDRPMHKKSHLIRQQKTKQPAPVPQLATAKDALQPKPEHQPNRMFCFRKDSSYEMPYVSKVKEILILLRITRRALLPR